MLVKKLINDYFEKKPSTKILYVDFSLNFSRRYLKKLVSDITQNYLDIPELKKYILSSFFIYFVESPQDLSQLIEVDLEKYISINDVSLVHLITFSLLS